MDELVDGVKRFHAEVFPERQPLFRRLASGQSPRAMFVTCSDSRVVPELITQSEPGDLFICRNVGNIVPPHSQLAGSVAAAVEYAVVALDVADIIVCGHTDCGAMKGVLKPDGLEALPAVATWLHHASAAREVALQTCTCADEPGRLRVLTRANVLAQMNNLKTHPAIAARLATGKLRLHGWIFDIDSGEVISHDKASGRWHPLIGERLRQGDVPADLSAVA